MNAIAPKEPNALGDALLRETSGRGDGHTNVAPPARAGTRWRWQRLLAATLSVAGLAAVAFYFSVPQLYVVGTDDANVDAHVVTVVPKVAAYVSALHVDDNSKVAANALLVELDPRDFEVAVRSTNADLQGAEASAANIDAQLIEQKAIIAQSEAAVSGDRSTLEFARQQLERYNSLAHTGFGTIQRWQQAQSDHGQSQAILQRDLAALDTARAHVGVLETQRRQALAAIERQKAILAQAQLNLSYTKIYSTVTSTVASKKVRLATSFNPARFSSRRFQTSFS